MSKAKKPRQTSLIEKKPRLSNTDVLILMQEHDVKGTYQEVYAIAKAKMFLESKGFSVSKK